MAVPPVTNFFEAVMVSLAAAMATLLSFIPALIGAVILLVIGWLLSDLLARLVVALLERVGFETAAARTGVTGFLGRTGMRDARAGFVIGELVKWFIRLIFIEAAAQAVHLQAVTQVINQVILFIPNLVVALIVLMVGAMIARFVAGIVRGSASEAGFRNPNTLATVAQYAIMVFAVLIAVNQVGIAATLVNALFVALVGALALALGLAFGLGGREVAAQMWLGWYQRSREIGPRLEAAAQRRAGAPPQAPSPQPAPAPSAAQPAPGAPPQPAPHPDPQSQQGPRPSFE